MTNRLIIDEAKRRGWRVEIIDEARGLIRYIDPQGGERIAKSVVTSASSVLHLLMTDNKDVLYNLAKEWGIAIPETVEYTNSHNAHALIEQYGRIVVKPHKGAHGNGVTTNVTDLVTLEAAIEKAKTISDRVLLQRYVSGEDYRLLFIGHEFRAAAIRKPAAVIGDGQRTVQELIERENKQPNRGVDYEKPLNKINVESAKQFLTDRIQNVPMKGEEVAVVGTANIGTGGYAIDVTDQVPSAMMATAKTLVEKLHMPLCGIDFIYNEQDGPILIEVNNAPSFGLHVFPYKGASRPVASHFMDWLQTLPS